MKFLAAAPHPSFPLPGLAVAALCAVYLLFGSIGHDPWKADDAVHLGVAYNILVDGDWLIPRIAGDAWYSVTPFYHWVAAATAWLTQWALPFHDGARLASALFGALFLFLLYRAAVALHGRDAGLAAPLLAIGTIGLLVPIHDAQPAIAVLAAIAAAYVGLARLPNLAGGAWLGVGCGGAFLFGGVDSALPLLPLLLLPLLQGHRLPGLLAIGIAAALAGIWPALLVADHPGQLAGWWDHELGSAALHADAFGTDHLELLAWFTWPILPYGAWTAWVERRRWRSRSFALPLFGTVLALGWFLAHGARPVQALPVIPPLALLAALGAHRLRRGAANAFDWFGMMTFSLVVGLIWLGGIAMWTGLPERIARNFAKLQPGFEAQFSFVALLISLAFTALWVFSLAKLPRSPWRGTIRWTAGVAAMWGVLVALWFPWIDYGKSYRTVAASLTQALAADRSCIERRGLGLAQRAVLDYHAGIRTQPLNTPSKCRWLLTLSTAPDGWNKVWEGHRPGDKSERLRLYRRE